MAAGACRNDTGDCSYHSVGFRFSGRCSFHPSWIRFGTGDAGVSGHVCEAVPSLSARVRQIPLICWPAKSDSHPE